MNRRKFFRTSTAAVSSLLVARPSLSAEPVRSEPAKNPQALHLGTVTYNLGRSWDIETLIKNCTETQFEGVELRTTHAHGVEIDTSSGRRKEIRRRFEDSPVQIVGIGSACEYHSTDPAEVRKNIEETKAFVKLAHDVGAPGIKVRPNGLPEGVPEEKTLEQIGRSLRECGAFAAGYGVQIRMEVHGRETSRLPRIRKILDYADHDNVWICWNSNDNDLLDGGLESNFNLVKSRIGLVHMRDLYREEYPWRRLFGLLHGIQYAGFCLAEIPE
ncbi:sugar phosphate isomerase/epimerase, partial [Acidobacteria bacterium AH-259-A15]|nr:sugar phosphate isomerase/epimerase [Acidobacteria bacterium AH-259-A15]